VNEAYFESEIRPLLQQPGVEFLGELDETAKRRFLAGASALLFPIDWPEPFGLVMIEAMACGTPVIAFRRGSVPEIIEEGRTGFIVDDLDGAIAAVGRIGTLDREGIVARFHSRFTIDRMVDDYLSLYERLLDRPVALRADAYGQKA
jgi:glycosyltransferase involved in cell wall biosynthesis